MCSANTEIIIFMATYFNFVFFILFVADLRFEVFGGHPFTEEQQESIPDRLMQEFSPGSTKVSLLVVHCFSKKNICPYSFTFSPFQHKFQYSVLWKVDSTMAHYCFRMIV